MDSRKSFYQNPAQCILENASNRFAAKMCGKCLPFFRLTKISFPSLTKRFCSFYLQIHTAPYKNIRQVFLGFAVYTLKIWRGKTSAMLLWFLKSRWLQCTSLSPPPLQNWMQTFLAPSLQDSTIEFTISMFDFDTIYFITACLEHYLRR